MSFQDLLRDTLATLWAHKRRTMLTMFGVAWRIISIRVMVAAGEGLGKGIQNNQETFGKDVMIVFAGRTRMQAGGTRSGRLIRWGEEDYIQVAKEAPACKYVMPELGNNVQVHSLFNSGNLQVVGALPPFTEIRSITVAQGRFYNEQDNAEARNVAFLGSDAKKQLFAEREALGQTISLNGFPYTVIGVMKPKEQNSSYDGADVRKIFIPFNSMRRDFPNKPPAVEHSVDRLLVAPWSLETHPDCVKQIRRSLGRLHNFDPQISLYRHWSHEAEGTKFQLRRRRRPQNFHPVQFHAPRFSKQAAGSRAQRGPFARRALVAGDASRLRQADSPLSRPAPQF